MNKMVIVAGGAIVTAAASAVVSIYTAVRMNRILKKLNQSMCDLEASTEGKIKDTMIKAAVAKAANNKVGDYLQDVHDDVIDAAKKQLNLEAKLAVSKCADEIRDKASAAIQGQVESLDIEELKKRICDQAEKTALRKLNGCLDKTVENFRNQLKHDREVYNAAYRVAMDDDGDVHVVLI